MIIVLVQNNHLMFFAFLNYRINPLGKLIQQAVKLKYQLLPIILAYPQALHII